MLVCEETYVTCNCKVMTKLLSLVLSFGAMATQDHGCSARKAQQAAVCLCRPLHTLLKVRPGDLSMACLPGLKLAIGFLHV